MSFDDSLCNLGSEKDWLDRKYSTIFVDLRNISVEHEILCLIKCS